MGGCTSRPTVVDGPHPEAPPAEKSVVAPELEAKPVEGGGDAPTEAEAAEAQEPQLVDPPAATTGEEEEEEEELKPESSAAVPEKPEDKEEDAPTNEVSKESKEEEKRSQLADHPLAAASEGSKTS